MRTAASHCCSVISAQIKVKCYMELNRYSINQLTGNVLKIKSFFKRECQTFDGSSFLNVRICCFSFSYIHTSYKLNIWGFLKKSSWILKNCDLLTFYRPSASSVNQEKNRHFYPNMQLMVSCSFDPDEVRHGSNYQWMDDVIFIRKN